jgi:hypothetical protein
MVASLGAAVVVGIDAASVAVAAAFGAGVVPTAGDLEMGILWSWCFQGIGIAAPRGGAHPGAGHYSTWRSPVERRSWVADCRNQNAIAARPGHQFLA